jgi:hypothetical protein
MDRSTLLVAVALCFAGCRQSGCGKGSDIDIPPDLDTGPRTRFAAPLPTDTEASPTKIVIKNETGTLAKLDVTWGEASFVSVAPVDGSLGLATIEVPDGIYQCRCDPSLRCLEYEEPMDRFEELAPLEDHEISWNGKLLRNRLEDDGDLCGQSYAPTGLYLFKACTHDRQHCGVARVQLPTHMPIILTLKKSMISMDRCPLPEGTEKRLSSYHLVRLELSETMLERIASCDPASAVCVDQHELAQTIEAVSGEPCSMFVVPRRSELESLIYLPRPEGEEGGERYSLFFDEHGTSVVFVKYDP